MINLFDTHAHLDQPEFDADRADVIARATAAGVENILAIGISADTSEACVRLATEYDGVHAAVGMQPNYLKGANPEDWDRIVEMLDEPGVVAIGETGLDRYWDFTPFDVQQDYFDRHIRLSQQRGLPFIVHMRNCDDDILVMLRDARARGPLSGVMHSFTGSRAMMDECVSQPRCRTTAFSSKRIARICRPSLSAK
jgi:TatD DNase family protein